MLEQWDEIWDGDAIGPAGRPTVILGGSSGAAFRRAAAHDGWIMGGGSPDQFREGLAKLEEAWQAAGREGAAHDGALVLRARRRRQEAAQAYLGDYYALPRAIRRRWSSTAPPRTPTPCAPTCRASPTPAATS